MKKLSFDEACETANLMEATECNLNEMQSNSSVSAVRGKSYVPSQRNAQSVFTRLNTQEDWKNKRQRLKCFLCDKPGHTVRFCYKNPNRLESSNGERKTSIQATEEGAEESLNFINSVLEHGPVLHEVCINDISIKFEIDTSACRTVMHRAHKENFLPQIKMSECSRTLYSVSGQKLKITENCWVRVSGIGGMTEKMCELIIVESEREFIPLLGRNWLDILVPSWRNFLTIKNISVPMENTKTFVDKLKVRYPVVFANIAKGTIKDFTVDIHIDEEAKPIFFKPYTVPFGLREAVEKEIVRLCAAGIIYPVRHSEWASPVVIVSKPNNEIRMCVDVDCKVTINKYIKTHHCPLPRIDDLLASLGKSKYFCALDLREAYAQLAVSEKSQQYLTINTHMGLFRYRRLIFGASCAPTVFQSRMDKIIQGLKSVACFIDDLLVGGETMEECRNTLLLVLDRLSEYNVKVKFEKCKFFESSVLYLGHEISAEGIRPNNEKVKAIILAPVPQNVTQVKSFVGLINYYGRFIPNLSKELIELYKLTKTGAEFIWSEECNLTFERSKKLLIQHNLLAHYDPHKEIVIHTDASPYGFGAVLSHVHNGVERPVLFTSCTLTLRHNKIMHSYIEKH